MTFAKSLLAASFLATSAFGAGLAHAESKSAYFAGGCFWCIEKDFEHVNGVSEVESGYQGGELENPTYRNHTGHREVVRIDYDSSEVSYEQLLTIFLRSINPTDDGGQFCDRGFAYTTAVYAQTDAEKLAAQNALSKAADDLGKPIATVLEDFSPFTKAEEYHQNYYLKNPIRYKFYRHRCGRNQTVEQVWGDAAYVGVDKALPAG